MPFRDVIGHRRLVALLARSRRARLAAAEPDLRRARRRRQAPRRRRARAGAQLPGPDRQSSRHRAAADALQLDACGELRGLHADRARRPPRRRSIVEPGDNGSIKIDQVRDVVDRAGYRPFEGRRRVVDHRRGGRAGRRGAERAAEDARGAAVRVGVHPRHVASRRAAADGAVALSAAAVPAARRRRDRGGADAARAQREPRRARWRRPPTAASATRSTASAGELVEARDVARARAGAARPSATIRGAGSRAPRNCWPSTGGGGASDREQLAVAPARDGVAAARRRAARDRRGRRALANADVRADARAAVRRSAASAASARLRRSTARWWRSSATPASRSWPTGWCCSCRSHMESESA